MDGPEAERPSEQPAEQPSEQPAEQSAEQPAEQSAEQRAEGARGAGGRRHYESPLRRQQAAVTRDRILAAATEMVHGFPTWDWGALTIRAVARRAQVNESTVYRYFSNERRLRDAVMRRLEQEAGVDLEGLRLEEFGDVVGRMFAYLSSFPVAQPPPEDPTFADIDERRRRALIAAVSDAAVDWPDEEAELAAAMLDVFWNVPSYERLTVTWKLDPERATRAVNWVIATLGAAVRAGDGPGGEPDGGPGEASSAGSG
ncbi:TetR family transcriptional regulator [Frankia sp. CcI49]|uniref:TetR family transcriptional regulator n=1 Tax=Frankia sp. CcI49 TaxID=1745382 RepID=UPI0026B18CD4